MKPCQKYSAWATCGWASLNTESKMLCSLHPKNINSSTFYQLNHTDIPLYDISAGLNFALFGICTVTVILTCWRFNSITVLNISVRPTAISNMLWIFYFSILGIRSLILGIVYVEYDDYILTKSTIPKVLFPLENVFKILELLFLSWALEYQRKHRSRGFIQDEIEQFNDRTEESTNKCRYFKKVLKTIYNVFTAQAFLCLVFLVVFTVFLLKTRNTSDNDKLVYLYWTFHGCVWSLCISCIVLMIMIVVHRAMDEGPSILTKVLLFFGVLFTLPDDIPLFIWQHCMFEQGSPWFVGCYITSQALSIIAVIIFLAVVIREFHRLKEEAQWNVIDQAESYYNISDSI